MARLIISSALSVVLVAGFGSAAGGAAGRSGDTVDRQYRGLPVAKARCSGCHSVVKNGTSPNPEAPSFEEIANRPGLTRATMRQFLSDSHNYPAAMGFTLDAAQVAELSDYVITLQRPAYRPIM